MPDTGYWMLELNNYSFREASFWSGWRVFFAAFFCLLLANLAILLDPPYWDAIFHMSQAIWLKNNHFNYAELYHLPGYSGGGPNTNIFYLLAPLYALLLKYLTPETTFFILHIFNVSCAAITFTLFFSILRTFMPAAYAVVWCAAAVVDPIFSGQTAAIYIEMPQAAAYGAVIYSLYTKRYVHTCMWCVVAYLIKDAALIMGIALFVWFVLKTALSGFFSVETPNTRWDLKAWPVLLAFPIFLVLIYFRPYSGYILSSNPSRVFPMFLSLFPNHAIMVILLFCFIVFLLLKKRWVSLLRRDETQFHILLLMVILVSGFWTSFFLFYLPLCRYSTNIIFPMVTLFGILVFQHFRRLSLLAGILLIAFGCFNQYGTLLPVPSIARSRSGETLERSREYLFDLEANRRICRELEERFSDKKIVVKFPFAHILTIPELGYVKKPLPNIYSLGMHPMVSSSKAFSPELLNDADVLFLYSPNVFEYSTRPSLWPDPGDLILYQDNSLRVPMILFERKE